MKKVGIAELKAKLSEHIRAVRDGETIVVMDRATPVAQLERYRVEGPKLRVRPPKNPHTSFGAAVRALPPRPPLNLPPDLDPVAWLIADRKRR